MKIVRERINEKFTEDSDPIEDMGIGLINYVKKARKNLYNAYEEIKKQDGGYEFLAEDINEWRPSSLLESISIDTIYYKILFSFYYAKNLEKFYDYRSVKTKRIITSEIRKEYCKKYIQLANLEPVIDINSAEFLEWNDKIDESYIIFDIDPKWINLFEKHWEN